MIELKNKALRTEISGLKKELAATNEALKIYVECYVNADDRRCALMEEIAALKKENEARCWECLAWRQKHDALLMGLHK